MDTSFWKNLSLHIKIQSSVKNFYNEYYYKLDIHAPGCKSIRCDDIAVDIDKRRTWVRDYKRQGSWYNKQLYKYLKEADVGFLYSLKDLYYEYPDVKVRTEEPKISVYATDELMLQSIARSIDSDHRDKIISITGPENDEIKALLNKNIILVKKPPKYRYRIWFKEKQCSAETRTQILSYLLSLGDLVRMTDHTRDSLSKPYDWIWGSYFYSNDRDIATFIRLINPDIIREVSEFVCVDNK
jgi:hypothetical protein